MTQELLDRIETLAKENSSLRSSLEEVKQSFKAHKEESQTFLTSIGGAEFNRAQYEDTMARNQRLEELNLQLKDENVRLEGINRQQEALLAEATTKLEKLQAIVEEIKREIAIKEASYSSMMEQMKLQIRTLTDANKSTTDVHGDSPSSS